MKQDVTENPPTLSERQLRAVLLLTATRTFTEVAERFGISRKTISLWLNDPAFREDYERQWDETAVLSTAEIQVLMLKSFVALAERLVSEGPRRPVPARRGLAPIVPVMTDAEIEREAHKRLIQLLTDAKNVCNGAGHAKHRTVSRPREHWSEIPSFRLNRTPDP